MIRLDIYRMVCALDVHPGDTILDPAAELEVAVPFHVHSIRRDIDGTVTFGAKDEVDNIIVDDGTDTIRVLPTESEQRLLWTAIREAIKVAVGEWADRWESDQADAGLDRSDVREAMPTPPWTVNDTTAELDVAIASTRGAVRFVMSPRDLRQNGS